MPEPCATVAANRGVWPTRGSSASARLPSVPERSGPIKVQVPGLCNLYREDVLLKSTDQVVVERLPARVHSQDHEVYVALACGHKPYRSIPEELCLDAHGTKSGCDSVRCADEYVAPPTCREPLALTSSRTLTPDGPPSTPQVAGAHSCQLVRIKLDMEAVLRSSS